MAAGLALGVPTAAAAKKPAPPPPSTTPNQDEWNLINLTATDVSSANGGAGAYVAVLDGLTDCRHSEFAGSSGQRCDNTLIQGGRYRFYDNHGTHTAGTVAGAKHGVAPSAYIYNYAVFDDRYYVATGNKLINAWLNASSRGAAISSMSFGCTKLALCFTADEVTAMASGSLSSMLFIKAAGNDGAVLSNESIAVSGSVASTAMQRLILVGSVNVTGTISSFSNRPGENCLLPSGATGCADDLKWKNHFIVAPGENIYAALPGNSYGNMSGTSMATPIVAGAAALLQARWPALKSDPAKLASILFETAKDVGEAGVDPVYGWGLLDVANAFRAQGSVTMLRTSGTRTAVAGSSVTTSRTFDRIATALGDVTVYDRYDRDFALRETGALQLRPSLYPHRRDLGRRLLEQGTQEEWSSSLFAPAPIARGFLRYGPANDVARSPLSPDRYARIGVDVPFKGGTAQFRMTGASATRLDLASDPSLRPLSFFASSALLDSSMLGHAQLRLSGKSALSLYAARSADPVSALAERMQPTTAFEAERQMRLTSSGNSGEEQRKTTLGAGYWMRPDSRTVIGLNASMIDQKGGWYDLSFRAPEGEASTRIVNVGAVASRWFGAWEATAATEFSHLRGSGAGLFNFTPTGLVSAEASVRRSSVLFSGKTADSVALAVTLPPRALFGSLSIEHLAPTEDGLGRRTVAGKYALSKLGSEGPKLEAAYRVGGEQGWSLGLAGGLGFAGKARGAELMMDVRLPLGN
ncbi:MAG TPA: S8 family serine peptidase [Sphingomicrobium sp.]|nr:S8 family serine peptidase [Sphingomicrobium sp.]